MVRLRREEWESADAGAVQPLEVLEIIYRRPRVLRAQNGITWHQPPHCLTADLPFMTEIWRYNALTQ
jgi:hypothetical protein